MAKRKFESIVFTVLITVSTLGLTNAQWAIDDNGCRTPDRGVGNCVIVRECKNMIDFLRHVPLLSPKIVRVLRKYQCGYQGKSVKVCCPDKPLTLNVIGRSRMKRTPTPLNSTIPSPPDVSNHRNIQLLPSVSECGPVHSRNRIINGNKTGLYEFPWMALLSYQTRSGPDFRCEGTLINERYVLTAAHCITDFQNLTLIGVRLGEYNISSVKDCEKEGKNTVICADPVQDIDIEEVIPHPNYDSKTFSNDIGLLRLKSPAQLRESVQPICLPADETLRNKNFENAKLVVTGWGSTETVNRSDDLLKVEIRIVPEAKCKTAYNETPAVINYRQLCAGGVRHSCEGESGEPLQTLEILDDDVHFVQYGIVSFRPRNCGQEGIPGVYTRIDYYMDWILDNLRA